MSFPDDLPRDRRASRVRPVVLTASLPPVVDLFNNLNLFYSVVTEFCTVENNPTMSAGPGCGQREAQDAQGWQLTPPSPRMDYTWIDASRKRVKLPAPQYIDYVLTWVEGLIKDESVFPTKAGARDSCELSLERQR